MSGMIRRIPRGASVSVADYGAVGAGNETASFLAAVAAAVANGTRRVSIPFAAFTVNTGTDCSGCAIVGAGTALTGTLVNHAGLENMVAGGVNASDMAAMPRLRKDNTPKLLWRSTSSLDYVIAQKETRGYTIAEFTNGKTTTTDSLAATVNDATRRRLSDVKDVVWAGVCKHANSATSGVWTEPSMNAGTAFANMIPANTSGTALKYWTANQNGDYIEFSVKPTLGRINVGFFTGTTHATAVAITVNGVAVATINPRAAAANTLRVFSFAAAVMDGEAATVRVTHAGTNGDPLSVIGCQFFELKDWSGQDADAFGYYRNATVWGEYINPNAANEIVIKEFTSGLYGGSYHGGESAIVSEWLADGAAVAPAVGAFVLAKSLVLRSTATVTWPAAAGSMDFCALWHFGAGAISLEESATGAIVADEAYSGMSGVKEQFTEVLLPKKLDLTGYADLSRVPLGRVSCVLMRNPTTGQRYRYSHSVFNREENAYNGTHIRKVVGSYNKIYSANVMSGKRAITELRAVTVHEFE